MIGIEGHRTFVLGILPSSLHWLPHLGGVGGDPDAEVMRQAAHRGGDGGALGVVMLAGALQALDALLFQRLHRRGRRASQRGFERSVGIGAIGLASQDIRRERMWGL